MIKNIKVGDITSSRNHADIIIGMNSSLSDVSGIGIPFVKKIQTVHPITLGSVLSFEFSSTRNLHMIVCHHLGDGGWIGADEHIRFGMDYLWHTEGAKRRFSIVQIGTGRVGARDGASHIEIRTAIATSFLLVDLYVYAPEKETATAHVAQVAPLRAYRAWHPVFGQEVLTV